LYIWWTKVRPLRKDPWTLSGSDQFWKDKSFSEMLSIKGRDKDLSRLYADRANEIEEAYLAEDNKQLERLIKIRHCLWT